MKFLIYFEIFCICLNICLANIYSNSEVGPNLMPEDLDRLQDKSREYVGLFGIENLSKFRPFGYNIWKGLLGRTTAPIATRHSPLRTAIMQRSRSAKIKDGIRF